MPDNAVPSCAPRDGFEDVATIELTVRELRVRVISIDDVIASKRALGRPKDLAVMPALYATREALRRRRKKRPELRA